MYMYKGLEGSIAGGFGQAHSQMFGGRLRFYRIPKRSNMVVWNANSVSPQNDSLDFGGFDPCRFLSLRGGIPRQI